MPNMSRWLSIVAGIGGAISGAASHNWPFVVASLTNCVWAGTYWMLLGATTNDKD